MNDGGDWKDMFKGIQEDDPNLVLYHIKNGIDVNYQHPEYMTSPLIESIRLGNLSMVKLFLKHGASADVKEMFTDKLPLHVAVEYKNREIIQVINDCCKVKLRWWQRWNLGLYP